MRTLIFLAVIVVALAVLTRTLYRRFTVLTKTAPEPRFDRVAERLRAVVVYGFGQKTFVRGEQPTGDKPSGWMHFAIFWGFLILGVQVIHMFGRGFVTDFTLPEKIFLTNGVGKHREKLARH